MVKHREIFQVFTTKFHDVNQGTHFSSYAMLYLLYIALDRDYMRCDMYS